MGQSRLGEYGQYEHEAEEQPDRRRHEPGSDSTAGPLTDILYASACLPGLLPPAILDGVRHVDGGVLEPVPVNRAVDLDAKRIFVLGEPPDASDVRALSRSPLDVLLRSFWISRYARLPNPASLARFGQEVIVVPGSDTAGISITDFSNTRRLIDESYEVSSRFLDSLPGMGIQTSAVARAYARQS